MAASLRAFLSTYYPELVDAIYVQPTGADALADVVSASLDTLTNLFVESELYLLTGAPASLALYRRRLTLVRSLESVCLGGWGDLSLCVSAGVLSVMVWQLAKGSGLPTLILSTCCISSQLPLSPCADGDDTSCCPVVRTHNTCPSNRMLASALTCMPAVRVLASLKLVCSSRVCQAWPSRGLSLRRQ